MRSKINIALKFLIIALVATNIFYLSVHCYLINKNKTVYYEPGIQFRDFKEPLSGVRTIGYLTDKDMTPDNNDGIFLQAQYYLAPVILDLGNADHTLFIIDSNDDIQFLVDTLKRNQGVRIANNDYGQALIYKE